MQVKKHQPLKVKRTSVKIVGNTSRVIARLHLPDDRYRIFKIIRRIMSLSETPAENLAAQTMIDFSRRHDDIKHIFERHLNEVEGYLPRDTVPSEVQKTLIGAYFTKEYAIESAALFNPSIVTHPDQGFLKKGSMRFVMSLRATGEGHISSIVFRSGVLDRRNRFLFDSISDFVETPDLKLDPVFKRNPFQRKLNEMGAVEEITAHILNQLKEDFSFKELLQKIEMLRAEPHFSEASQDRTFEVMCWLADSNYQVSFHADHRISERVIFPVSKNESRGIEDARFVRFSDNRQEVTYYATYTAYNGDTTLPQLIETKDFINFNILTLNSEAYKIKAWRFFREKSGVVLSCFRDRTVKIIISCSQTISISGRNPKSSRSRNFRGNSSKSAIAAHRWKPIKVGLCLPTASGRCEGTVSAPYCSILIIQQRLLPAWMSRCCPRMRKNAKDMFPMWFIPTVPSFIMARLSFLMPCPISIPVLQPLTSANPLTLCAR
jgi:predicted GH43/DUF377 family glycosyl hydrolase